MPQLGKPHQKYAPGSKPTARGTPCNTPSRHAFIHHRKTERERLHSGVNFEDKIEEKRQVLAEKTTHLRAENLPQFWHFVILAPCQTYKRGLRGTGGTADTLSTRAELLLSSSPRCTQPPSAWGRVSRPHTKLLPEGQLAATAEQRTDSPQQGGKPAVRKPIPARGQNARVTAPPVHLGTQLRPPKLRGARSSISGLSQQAQSSLKMLASTQSPQKERKLDPDHTNTSTNASTTRRVASFSETKRSYGLRMRSP